MNHLAIYLKQNKKLGIEIWINICLNNTKNPFASASMNAEQKKIIYKRNNL